MPGGTHYYKECTATTKKCTHCGEHAATSHFSSRRRNSRKLRRKIHQRLSTGQSPLLWTLSSKQFPSLPTASLPPTTPVWTDRQQQDPPSPGTTTAIQNIQVQVIIVYADTVAKQHTFEQREPHNKKQASTQDTTELYFSSHEESTTEQDTTVDLKALKKYKNGAPYSWQPRQEKAHYPNTTMWLTREH